MCSKIELVEENDRESSKHTFTSLLVEWLTLFVPERSPVLIGSIPKFQMKLGISRLLITWFPKGHFYSWICPFVVFIDAVCSPFVRAHHSKDQYLKHRWVALEIGACLDNHLFPLWMDLSWETGHSCIPTLWGVWSIVLSLSHLAVQYLVRFGMCSRKGSIS